MTDHECAKTLRRGLDKYLEDSMYVPGFADALRHAIYELERPDKEQSKKGGSNWMMDRFMQVR